MKKITIITFALLALAGGATVVNAEDKKTAKNVDPTEDILSQQKKAFEEANAALTAKMDSVQNLFFSVKTGDEQRAIYDKNKDLYAEYSKAQQKYVSENPSTVLTASFIAPSVSYMSFDEAKAAYDKFSDDAKNSQYGKSIKKEIDTREKTQPGKPAPMIAKNDIDGNPFSLADLRGNVVILDFWASWCVPCRASNPHMMRIYDKYHDKGLKMVYVADNDEMVDKLRDAIKKDGVGRPDIHHLLRGLKTLKDKNGKRTGFDRSEDVSDLYAVHSIPTKFLIDKEGNIIGKVESEEWLDEQLKKIYGE